MSKLVTGEDEVRGDGAVGIERDRETDPHLALEENVAERAGGGEERQVAERLEPALQVVGPHQFEKDGALDRAAVPSDLEVLADVVQRLGLGGHLRPPVSKAQRPGVDDILHGPLVHDDPVTPDVALEGLTE